MINVIERFQNIIIALQVEGVGERQAWHFKTLELDSFTTNWFLKEFPGKVNSEMFGSALAAVQNINYKT